MIQHDYDTGPSWRILNSLLSLVVFLIVLFFGYLLLEDEINKIINRPTVSKEQMAESARMRAIKKRQERNDNWDLVENGIHVKTGLKDDPNLKLIIGNCTSCHSAKLITQNRATREGWENMIDWMQETQGLHDLGNKEPIIVRYLATHYAPKESGRRINLDVKEIEWYILNLDESGE